MNLWQTSGLDEGRFSELMHEARQTARRYESRPSWDHMDDKMAYLFAALRDLLARANTGWSAPDMQPWLAFCGG